MESLASSAQVDNESLVGEVVDRRYDIVATLGAGTAAVVYLARSRKPALATHGRKAVAIKVLRTTHLENPDALAWFTHEAFLGTRLSHPNLMRVLDFGFVAKRTPYYAMELYAGETLDALLRRSETLRPNRALPLLDDAARGLEYLHNLGLVHRDIKPANLFVATHSAQRPRLHILDLGLAGIYDARRARPLGSVNVGAKGSRGTPAYIAPEQALGLTVDPRADVYSLACVAYRMLTGYRPVGRSHSSHLDVVRAHLFEKPKPPTVLNPTLPQEVDDVLLRALAKEPSARTRTAAELVSDLKRALTYH